MLAPVEAEPADVFLNRVDVFLLFLDRVGVVEAQVAAAAELLGDPEAERDRLGVAEVEVSVRLGREARHNLRDSALAHVGGDDLADEIASFGRGWSAGAVARHLDQSSAVRRHVRRSRCTHAQVTTSPHTRKPPASSDRRAASRALMNSSDLASLCLPSSLTTPRHLAGEDKAPAPRWRDGTSAQALLASTGNIWPTRNTQPEAGYAQLARHAASGATPSTRHHCLPASLWLTDRRFRNPRISIPGDRAAGDRGLRISPPDKWRRHGTRRPPVSTTALCHYARSRVE